MPAAFWESTSLRPQPRVTMATVVGAESGMDGSPGCGMPPLTLPAGAGSGGQDLAEVVEGEHLTVGPVDPQPQPGPAAAHLAGPQPAAVADPAAAEGHRGGGLGEGRPVVLLRLVARPGRRWTAAPCPHGGERRYGRVNPQASGDPGLDSRRPDWVWRTKLALSQASGMVVAST